MNVTSRQHSPYVDFELEVGNGSVSAKCRLTGEARAAFVSPYDDAARQALHDWLQHAARTWRGMGGAARHSLHLDNPQQIGDRLFQALFPPAIATLYAQSRAIVRDRELGGLRLKLRLLDDAAPLPWELLYDPRDDYLALSPRLTLVRYLEAAVPVRPIAVDGPLRILLFAGAPDGLDLAAEIGRIQAALEPNRQVVVEALNEATLDGFYEKVRTAPFHIVHYMGHSEAPGASGPARLLLSNGAGGAVAIDVDGIWRTLRRAEQLRLIWLNSCSSAVGSGNTLAGPLTSAAARFVASGVPAVVANQVRISDDAAITLAQAFYGNLAARMPVDVALAEARLKVSVTDLSSLEWATPVLCMRAPDGMLFEAAPPPAAATPAGRPTGSGSTTTVGNIIGSSNVAIGPGAQVTTGTSGEPQPPAGDPDVLRLLQEQLRDSKRRLAQRELQRARYGISADPSIVMEIEDLRKDITKLEQRIADLS